MKNENNSGYLEYYFLNVANSSKPVPASTFFICFYFFHPEIPEA